MASSIPFLWNTNNLQAFMWPINRILKGTTSPGQSGPGSNGNEEVFHTLQNFRTGASPPDVV